MAPRFLSTFICSLCFLLCYILVGFHFQPGERPTQETDDVLIEILSSCNREQYNDISHIYEKVGAC